MLHDLLQEVYEANMRLPAHGLATLTWGNVSAVSRNLGLVAIKPSGVPYAELTPQSMAVVDLEGNRVSGGKPSSDTETHLVLYRRFSSIGGIAHMHSRWATVWAQAGRAIPILGTTHADYFCAAIPCTRPLTPEETENGYEQATGNALAALLTDERALRLPAALAAGHGPFTWGRTGREAVDIALALEETAMMAWHTLALDPKAVLPHHIAHKHHSRKHGKDAYYGQ